MHIEEKNILSVYTAYVKNTTLTSTLFKLSKLK